MARPAGVTTIAILFFLGTVYCVVLEIHLFVQNDVFSAAKTVFALINAEDALPDFGAILLVEMIVFPILYATAGWGLWKLRNWGRILTVGLLVYGSLFTSIRWLLTPHVKTSRSVATVISFAVYGVIISYLLKADVKAGFSSFNPASQVHKPSVHFIP